jgi:uncharacterized protein
MRPRIRSGQTLTAAMELAHMRCVFCHMDQSQNELAERFRDFIRSADFPCVGAKSALARANLDVIVANDIRSADQDGFIYHHIVALADRYAKEPAPFQSLAVLFEVNDDLDEADFEAALWKRLQSLSDHDQRQGQAPDSTVSSDPSDAHFSISFGGSAFFVVGMHPRSSRPARRFETPVLVFNPHDQFEQLRGSGVYSKLRTTIIERDIALAGSANPMLDVFGNISEGRQYSGRQVHDNWICPLRPRIDA